MADHDSENGDIIYPVNMLDHSDTFRDITVTWLVRFNDVLDSKILGDALWRLLELGDWRKIGGRLRNPGGAQKRLEIHAPRRFDTKRPPFSLSHRDHEGSKISEHPIARSLPESMSGRCIWPDPSDYHSLAVDAVGPQITADYLKGDFAMLSLHITSFVDGTLVGLKFPHVLMDAKGCQALLQAWSLVMAGRESEVLPLGDIHEDVLYKVTTESGQCGKNEPYQLAQGQLGLKGGLQLVGRFVSDALWQPNSFYRTLRIPCEFIEALRQQENAQLATSEPDKGSLLLSDSAMVSAWLNQKMARRGALTVAGIADLRYRLPDLLPPDHAYVQNLVLPTSIYLPENVINGTVHGIAASLKKDLTDQLSTGQLVAQLREVCKAWKGGILPQPHYVQAPSATIAFFTDWSCTHMIRQADFSKAVVRAGDDKEKRVNPPGSMVSHVMFPWLRGRLVRNLVIVLGKDHGGDLWVTASLAKDIWEEIASDLGIHGSFSTEFD